MWSNFKHHELKYFHSPTFAPTCSREGNGIMLFTQNYFQTAPMAFVKPR